MNVLMNSSDSLSQRDLLALVSRMKMLTKCVCSMIIVSVSWVVTRLVMADISCDETAIFPVVCTCYWCLLSYCRMFLCFDFIFYFVRSLQIMESIEEKCDSAKVSL